MWHKAEDNKPKFTVEILPSPDSSTKQTGAAVPSNTGSAPTTVSEGLKIIGEITGEGDFFVDGVFEGIIHIPGGAFSVGPHGRVTAEIEAREIIVHGEVTGTLKAHERIQIWNTAKVTGNVETRGIVIEDGAVLHSKVAVPQALPQEVAAKENQGASSAGGPEIAVRSKGAAAGASGQTNPQES
jgi:cytoskeletal protein CcmA (bactofilin family)